MSKYGIAALSLFSKILMIEYLISIFVIPCSLFAFLEYLFRCDWTILDLRRR